MTKQRNTLLISNGLISISLGLLGPIYALFVTDIGGDVLNASWAYAVYMASAGVVTYILGKWEDHYNHKEKFIFVGYLVLSMGCLSYLFVASQAMLLFTQALLGLGIAIAAPSFDALYALHTTKHKEASEWAMWESLNNIVLAVSAVLGGYIVSLYGFDSLFIVMAVLACLGALYTLRLGNV
jgi:DHA2 family methylenomycin A resistance protein-like MFS transporter